MTKCGLQEMPDFTLVHGMGNYDKGRACVMSAAVACQRLKNGEPLGEATDQMECCCPTIRAFLIRLNDSSMWQDANQRTEMLLPFVPRLADTRDDSLTKTRLYMIADWLVRTVLPTAMEGKGAEDPQNVAQQLRDMPEIKDKHSCRFAYGRLKELAASMSEAAYDSVCRTAVSTARAAIDVCDYYNEETEECFGFSSYAVLALAWISISANPSRNEGQETTLQSCMTLIDRLIALSEPPVAVS